MPSFTSGIYDKWQIRLVTVLFVFFSLILSVSSSGESDGSVAASNPGLFDETALFRQVPGHTHVPKLCAAAECAAAAGISFTPEVLQYSDSPVCIPTISEFTLNNEMDQDVHVYSIASDSSQFHPVSFQPQVLLPNDYLNIQLLFLPYHVQAIEASLTISTSVGEFGYSIVGKATSNPYNLHPFIGNKVIAGIPFEQPIIMMNPHDSVLHIREIFTTEEFLSLHRTGGDSDPAIVGGDDLYDPGSWELAAGDEREVIRLAMSSTVPGHYYGYVHVKTDKDKIVIPVDLQVLEGGLRAVDKLLDFGVFTQSNSQKVIELKLANSGLADVTVIDVLPAVADPQLTVDMRSPVVRAGMEEVVAVLVYNAGKPGKVSNKILVTTDNSNSAFATLEVPYEASMLQGGIGFNFNQSVFAVPIWNETKIAAAQMDAFQRGSAGYVMREIVFTNFFSVPVSLQGISAATCKNVINVIAIPAITSASRLESWSPVVLLFNVSNAIITSISKEGLPFTCWLELWTNISSHRIPLHVLDGDVNVKLLNEKFVLKRAPGKKKSANTVGIASKDNFDVHNIDFKKMNFKMPEGLLLSFENMNPQRIPLFLSNTTGPICICIEAMLPSSTVGKNSAQFFETLYPNKFVHRKSVADPNCSCYDSAGRTFLPLANINGQIDDGANVFQTAFGALLSTSDIEEDKKFAGFDPSGRSVKAKVASESAMSSFLDLKAGHTAFLSLHILGLVEGLSSVVVNISSPYQSKVFNINYSVVVGDIELKTGKAGGDVTFTMGRYQHMDVLAWSSFNFSLPIRSLTASSPHFSVPPELSLPNLPVNIQNLIDEGSNDISPHRHFSMIGGLVPDFSCVSEIPSADARQMLSNSSQYANLGILPPVDLVSSKSHRHRYPIWGCIRKALSIANIAGQRYQEGVGLPGSHDIGSALDSIDRIEQALFARRWSVAHDATLAFADEWEKLYPEGFALRPFNISLATDVSLSLQTVKNISVVLPTETTPPAADVILPPTRKYEAVELYVKVVNPYDVYLSFCLGDESDSLKGTQGTGSSPTASPVTPTALSIADLSLKETSNFIPALYPKSWIPFGCRRHSSAPTEIKFEQHIFSLGIEASRLATTGDEHELLSKLSEAKAWNQMIDDELLRSAEITLQSDILRSDPFSPNFELSDLHHKRIELLDSKLFLLDKTRELLDKLFAAGSEAGSKSNSADIYAEEVYAVQQAHLRAESELETLKSKKPSAAKSKGSEKKRPDELKSMSKSFFGGGIVDPKSGNSLNSGPLSANKLQDTNTTVEHSNELALIRKSFHFNHALDCDFSVSGCEKRRIECHKISSVWCGYTNPQTESFKYPPPCKEWDSISDAHTLTSPIVTGAVLRALPKSKINRYYVAEENDLISFSPFEISHQYPLEVVLPPHTTAYLGPIKFESPYEGIFQKTVYIVNNYTGTDRLHLVGETGSSDFILNQVQYVESELLASEVHTNQKLLNSSKPHKPFDSAPLIINNGEAGIAVIVRNENELQSVRPEFELESSQNLIVNSATGLLAYEFENRGILDGTVNDIELNGIRLCRDNQLAAYSGICSKLPHKFTMNSTWSFNLPLFVECSFAHSDLRLRLISSNDTDDTPFEARHRIVLGSQMVLHCLNQRSHQYTESRLLRTVKVFVFVICVWIFYYFWKSCANHRTTKNCMLLVDGEDIYGGISEVFLKHRHDEVNTASQRGRKATAIGSASAPEKKKNKYIDSSRAATIGGNINPSNTDRASELNFEDILKFDEICLPEISAPASSALRGYEKFCDLREKAIVAASKHSNNFDTADSKADATEPSMKKITQPEKIVGSGRASKHHGSTSNELSSSDDHESLKDLCGNTNVAHSTRNERRGAGSVEDTIEHSVLLRVSGVEPGMRLIGSAQSRNASKETFSPKIPPGLTTLNSNQQWGDVRAINSSEGDGDFDANDFNMLIDQDLRALLVKPGGSRDFVSSNAPPGFHSFPSYKRSEPADRDNASSVLPKLSLGEKNSSEPNYQEKFIDDLLLDEMSPLASDPTLKSFFSGVAAPHSESSKGRGGYDLYDYLGASNTAASDVESDDPFNSILHLLDTESLPLSLSSAESPAEPFTSASTPKHTSDKFSPKLGSVSSNFMERSFPTAYQTDSNDIRPGYLAASLTRPGDVVAGQTVSAQSRRIGGPSKLSSQNSYGYQPLTLDTSVPAAKISEMVSAGRYPKGSPTSASGLPLAAALPHIPGSMRVSPRLGPASGPPGLKTVGERRHALESGIKSKLAADIRSSTGATLSSTPPGFSPLNGPPGLSAPLYRTKDPETAVTTGDKSSRDFFAKGSFFGSSEYHRSDSRDSSSGLLLRSLSDEDI